MSSHGLEYLIAAVIAAVVFQLVLGLAGVARLMRFIPRSVMVGFVNALAILIVIARLPELLGVAWMVYPLAAFALLVMVGLPRVTTAVPAPLVAIGVLTLFTVLAGIDVPTVGDKGKLPDSLPSLFLPNVPLSWETLNIIAPFSLAMAFVGLLESLMTAKLVDDITDTRSAKTREALGQGVANVVTGFLGGVFLAVLVIVPGDVVALIPMAALVAVMIFVMLATFDWHSIRPVTLTMMPKSETAVMVVTVAVVVATHNLAIGVGVGVLLALVLFVRRVAHLVTVERTVGTVNGRDVASAAMHDRLAGKLGAHD